MSQWPPPPPVPSVPLGYAYDSSRRPGIITAIGVISIVVGSLSIVGSGISGLWGFGMAMVAQVNQAMNAAATTAPVGGTVAKPPPVVVEDQELGLDSESRAVIVETLAGLSGLNSERQEQLDTLLAHRGSRIFSFANQPVSARGVLARVSKYGTLPSADASKPGADYFLTAWGTVEVYDDHAVFRAEGSEPFSISAGQTPLGGEMTRDEAADAVVTKVQGLANINDAQAKALHDFITDPAQTILQDYTRPAAEVQYAQVDNEGSLNVSFSNGYIAIDSTGAVTDTFNYTGGTGWPGPALNINQTATSVILLEALASMALAVFLIVVGVLTLRQSLRARTLHLIYAGLKIPLAIICAWAWSAALSSLGSGGASGSWAIYFSVIAASFACIYPVALLIAMNSRAVKEYYLATVD